MSIAVPSRHIPLSTLLDASRAIYEAAVRTPLVRIELDAGPLRELYLKLEVLQPIGSFKIRGAYNAIRQLPPDALSEGVWTVSAGNAAQGVALAARKVGIPCSVMFCRPATVTSMGSHPRAALTTMAGSLECRSMADLPSFGGLATRQELVAPGALCMAMTADCTYRWRAAASQKWERSLRRPYRATRSPAIHSWEAAKEQSWQLRSRKRATDCSMASPGLAGPIVAGPSSG